MTPDEIEYEAALISNVAGWPNLFLPMTNKNRSYADAKKLGIVLENNLVTVWVHPMGMYGAQPMTAENGWTIESYDSVQAMVADGWVGD